MKVSRTSLADWILLAFLVAAWGSAFAMIKIAVAHFDPAWVMALRLAIAALVLAPYALAIGQPLTGPFRIWAKFSWLGFIGHAAPFFLVSWGTQYVSSGVSGLLMGAIPLFIVVLSHFFLPDEPITATRTLGFLLGFAGIVILIGPEKILGLSLTGDALMGELAILGGCLCYSVHAISAKRLGFDHPVRQTASVCIASAIMGLAFALAASPEGFAGKPQTAYLAVIGLGILPTALASLGMYRLLNRMGPNFVAYSNYLVPVYAVLFGAALLGEDIDWSVLTALVLIVAGIAISRLRPSRPAKAVV